MSELFGYRVKPTEMTEHSRSMKPEIHSINSRHLHSLIDAGYMSMNEAEPIYRQNGYSLDKRFSNDKHHVVLDKHNQVYVNFRGSNNWNDVLSDVYLGVGLEDINPRFYNSSKLLHNIRNTYQNQPIIGIGHSLGGSIVDHLNRDGLLDKGITINKGIGLGGIGMRNMDNQHDIRGATDPVSILALTQNGGQRTLIPGSVIIDPINAHSYKHLRKFDKKKRF